MTPSRVTTADEPRFGARLRYDRVTKWFGTVAALMDVSFEIGYGGQHKRQILPDSCDAAARELFHFFNSRPFVEFLEGLTAISGLIPDPWFVGGGFHETRRGGKLGIHADFRINEKLAVHRRINVIIYLNETWDEAWGGHLELWSRDMAVKEKSVAPLLNRAVVFNTDATSYHGHPDPLASPEGIARRSIALYYYTASRAIYDEVPANSTIYRSRPGDDPETRREARSLNRAQYLDRFVPGPILRYVNAVRRRLPF